MDFLTENIKTIWNINPPSKKEFLETDLFVDKWKVEYNDNDLTAKPFGGICKCPDNKEYEGIQPCQNLSKVQFLKSQ